MKKFAHLSLAALLAAAALLGAGCGKREEAAAPAAGGMAPMAPASAASQ